ncbi:MAG: hypothetical protein KAG98_00495 [Lentisphaeria bacterium]|nr:hypothetical protein [Lentisphaeria bacterium]
MQILSTILIVILYLAAMAMVPWMIIRLPSDYFSKEARENCLFKGNSLLVKSILLILKNLIGWILVLSGIAMLFLPGQGVLTVVTGVFLMDFPHKYKMEKWIISQPVVLKVFNKIRKKANKTAFSLG